MTQFPSAFSTVKCVLTGPPAEVPREAANALENPRSGLIASPLFWLQGLSLAVPREAGARVWWLGVLLPPLVLSKILDRKNSSNKFRTTELETHKFQIVKINYVPLYNGIVFVCFFLKFF